MIVTDLLQFLFHFIFIGFPTLLWQVWRPWEQVFQKISVCVVFVFRYLSQEILHVFIDFQIVCLSSFGNAVDNRAGSGSADGVDQLPVVPSDTKPRSVDSVALLSRGTSPSSRNTRRYLS
ncbi:hypothetical protein C823_006192 [Eubacterium plexicaudatum ASF492]|nr:hypothetical protein C823_006192 [Eubacterium plexicaudatum ASF492]